VSRQGDHRRLPAARRDADDERCLRRVPGEHHEFKTFFHGHTYTGNPLACAAALATLDVFESERTLERLAPKIELLGRLLEQLVAPLPGVAEVRRRGFMTGIQLAPFPVEDRMGHQVTLAARRRGAIVRPLGDVVVLMPPLSISEAELHRLVGITAAAIDEACNVAARPACAGEAGLIGEGEREERAARLAGETGYLAA
jgi:adenosylmethionine-8-amino-7-oxononanoate aminotransferase